MAREHARLKISIWDDDDFRSLSPAAQHLYFVLLAHPKLDYAGVTDWRPARLVGFAGAWTTQAVEIAAEELSNALFIIIDRETEEVLIRSFIRNDGFMDQPNMAVAMRKALGAISSSALRGIVIHELARLHKKYPDLRGWAKVSELLDRPSIDPSDYPSFQASDHPSIYPSGNPSVNGHPNPSSNPSGNPPPTTAPNSSSPLLAPNTTTTGATSREDRYVPAQRATDTDPPICTRHPHGDGGEACGGCRRVRLWQDRVEAEAQARDSTAAERARSQQLLDDIHAARAAAVPRPKDLT